MDDFAGDAEPLSRKGFVDVIDDLEVGIAELLAVLAVESRTCGFLPDRRPIILFERHVFHRRTGGRFLCTATPASATRRPAATRAAPASTRGWPRRSRLDREAALMSAS